MHRSGIGRSSHESAGMLHQVLDPLAEALLRRLGEGRNQAVGRIDDQGRTVRPVPVRDPELVVVAGRRVVGRGLGARDRGEHELVAEQGVRARVRRLGRRGHQLLQLLVGKAFLARPGGRTLQRRRVVVRPHALEIGMTGAGAGHGPVGVIGGVVAVLASSSPRRRRLRQRRQPCSATTTTAARTDVQAFMPSHVPALLPPCFLRVP